jgi:hypothetical protein
MTTFKTFSYADITPPLGFSRLFNLTIKAEEIAKSHILFERLVTSDNTLSVAQIKNLIAGDLAWIESYLDRLEQNITQQHQFLRFLAWFRPLFSPLYQSRTEALTHIQANKTAVKHLKAALHESLLILLNQARQNRLDDDVKPEDILAFEGWIKAHYPETYPLALQISHTYLSESYAPVASPSDAWKMLSDCQSTISTLKRNHALNKLPKLSFKAPLNTFIYELKHPGYSLKKIPFLMLCLLSTYLAMPTIITLGLLFYGLFRDTSQALWETTIGVSLQVQWIWQRLRHQDQLTTSIHWSPFLAQLEENAIFYRDYLATGPLKAATLDVNFFTNQLTARLEALKFSEIQLKTLTENGYSVADQDIYQKLRIQAQTQTADLNNAAALFSQRIVENVSLAFRLPDPSDLDPQLSPEQIAMLKTFIQKFGSDAQIEDFNKHTDSIQMFLRTLRNKNSTPQLTLPLSTPNPTTPISALAGLPFGNHSVNQTALGINLRFMLAYETNPKKARAIKHIIAVLSGKKAASKDKLTQKLSALNIQKGSRILDAIGHHLFLTKKEPTAAEARLYPKADRDALSAWKKTNQLKIQSANNGLEADLKRSESIQPQIASNVAQLIQGEAAYQYMIKRKPKYTPQTIRTKLSAFVALFKGDHLGFMSFIYPFWGEAPPSALTELCLQKRLRFALENVSADQTSLLIEDATLNLPTQSPEQLNLWTMQHLKGNCDYQESIETIVLNPLKEKGIIGEAVLQSYRQQGLTEMLSLKV